ncbi:MAG: tetratricopeptide repeat protein [Thiohalomonadales bacterium]
MSVHKTFIRALTILLTLLLTLLGSLSSQASPFDLQFSDQDELDAYIVSKDQQIARYPSKALYYLQRADAMFLNHDFHAAIQNYDEALRLQPRLVESHFGRGLALARAGDIEQGIKELSIYISHKPQSSLAYTKRGVRHIWIADYHNAKNDLEKAITLDNTNAEAHDDLGVVFAQNKEYIKAAEQFAMATKLDPSYQKAYHNMAVVGYITGNDSAALRYVDRSLDLAPQSRSSMLLKSEILRTLGRYSEATDIKDDADFLPEGNWSENVAIE